MVYLDLCRGTRDGMLRTCCDALFWVQRDRAQITRSWFATNSFQHPLTRHTLTMVASTYIRTSPSISRFIPVSKRFPSSFKMKEAHMCTTWGIHCGDCEECCRLGYKNKILTSHETHHVFATEPSLLTLCKIWGFHGGQNHSSYLTGDTLRLRYRA
jgi:hypothetical protein